MAASSGMTDLLAYNFNLETFEFLQQFRGTPRGGSLLHDATAEGDVDTVRLLLGQGVDPDCADDLGVRPVHLAAARGDVRLLGLLIAVGANPLVQDARGRTPHDHALQGGQAEAAAVLAKIMAHRS